MSSPEVRSVDVIVIGAGQAGGPLAGAFARAGRRTVLIERAHVGGTCINEGCTPTKTMVASARLAYLARRAGDYGVRARDVGVDLGAIRARKQRIVDEFRTGSERRLAESGVETICAEGSFVGPRTVRAARRDGSAQELAAELIFINTGARPSTPRLRGIDQVPWLDSTSIMELETLPSHLLVLGGGYIGLEFAQMFRRFGSRVTIVQRGERVLAREDDDVADAVAEIVRQDGIDLLLNASAERVERRGEEIVLTVRRGVGTRELRGSHLLVAAGRTPNTDRLDAERGAIALDEHGFVRVDEQLATSVPGVYALGDVKGGPAFTHISYDDFRIIRTNLLAGGQATTRNRVVPYTVFIDPQLGGVGLTESEAKRQGRPVRIAKIPMTNVARALETGESRGFMKIVVDGGSDRILGCSILGIDGGELMSMIQIAMMGELAYTALRDATFSHPTLAESLNTVFSQLTHPEWTSDVPAPKPMCL